MDMDILDCINEGTRTLELIRARKLKGAHLYLRPSDVKSMYEEWLPLVSMSSPWDFHLKVIRTKRVAISHRQKLRFQDVFFLSFLRWLSSDVPVALIMECDSVTSAFFSSVYGDLLKRLGLHLDIVAKSHHELINEALGYIQGKSRAFIPIVWDPLFWHDQKTLAYPLLFEHPRRGVAVIGLDKVAEIKNIFFLGSPNPIINDSYLRAFSYLKGIPKGNHLEHQARQVEKIGSWITSGTEINPPVVFFTVGDAICNLGEGVIAINVAEPHMQSMKESGFDCFTSSISKNRSLLQSVFICPDDIAAKAQLISISHSCNSELKSIGSDTVYHNIFSIKDPGECKYENIVLLDRAVYQYAFFYDSTVHCVAKESDIFSHFPSEGRTLFLNVLSSTFNRNILTNEYQRVLEYRSQCLRRRDAVYNISTLGTHLKSGSALQFYKKDVMWRHTDLWRHELNLLSGVCLQKCHIESIL